MACPGLFSDITFPIVLPDTGDGNMIGRVISSARRRTDPRRDVRAPQPMKGENV